MRDSSQTARAVCEQLCPDGGPPVAHILHIPQHFSSMAHVQHSQVDIFISDCDVRLESLQTLTFAMLAHETCLLPIAGFSSSSFQSFEASAIAVCLDCECTSNLLQDCLMIQGLAWQSCRNASVA